MLGKQVTLFKIFGFSVRVHASWLVIAVLVAWTLAEGVFRQDGLSFSPTARWIMGAIGSLGLFLSVVVHELCHSLVARRYGLEMRGITLFIFGGLAEMTDEPPNAKTEFLMAIAGPLASVAIGVLFAAMAGLSSALSGLSSVTAVLGWLGLINIVLAVFNMLPGFPLDGGRVLRSGLWAWKKDFHWATHVAANVGSGFGLLLIFLGVVDVISGSFVSGMWWFLIGMFIRFAAKQAYQQVAMRQTLHGEPVRRFMSPNPVAVPPSASLEELVEDYVYKYHHQMFPVVDNGRLTGCVGTQQLKSVPRQQWRQLKVQEVAASCSPSNTIDANADAAEAIAQMTKEDTTRLLVVDHGQLEGVVSMRDLVKFMAMKMELEGGATPSGGDDGQS